MEKRKRTIIICVLLFVFTLLSLLTIKDMSVTFDEGNFVTAGYSYWITEDFRLVVEHPPLTKLMAGFPLLFMTPEPVFSTETEAWQLSATTEGYYVYQWYVYREFFYTAGNDAEKIIFWSRVPFILLGLLLGVYIFLFAREMFNENTGLFALFLYAFCPLVLAYIPLAITDGAFAVFFFITVYYFWKWRKEQKTKYVVLTGLFLGLANATKFTGVYLIPIFGLLLFLEWYRNKSEQSKIGKDIVASVIIAGIAILVVALTYFFVHFPMYMEGFKLVAEHSDVGHRAYLFGEFSLEGWWYYFIVAFFVKTPIPLLLFVGTALYFWKKQNKNILDSAILFVPVLFYFVAFMMNNINIGIRHIFPIYPFLFVIGASIIFYSFDDKKHNAIKYSIIGILCLWYVASALFYFPSYLAYFNEFVGGPGNGHKILLDSNIDWSQDVERTEQWLQEHGWIDDALNYDVFTIEPAEYRGYILKEISCGPRIGLYVVSMNVLYNLGQQNQDCLKWLLDYEPVEKVGYSVYIYNITDSFIAAVQNQCTAQCMDVCEENNQRYVDYFYTDHCVCGCE